MMTHEYFYIWRITTTIMSIITSVLNSINYTQLLAIAIAAGLTKSLTFRVGNFQISATENGAPVHFTIGEALTAAEQVAAGKTGSFQIGSILVSVTEI